MARTAPSILEAKELFLEFSIIFKIMGEAIKAINAKITTTASNSTSVKPFLSFLLYQ